MKKTPKSRTEPRSRSKRAQSPRRAASAVAHHDLVESSARSLERKTESVRKPKRTGVPRRGFTAATADKHELYQLAVQSPDEDIRFFERIYRQEAGREAKHLREDFCGTGFLMSRWIQGQRGRTAEGFDIHGPTVAWGMAHNFAPLGEEASRATIHLRDVREPSHKAPDVRVAQNFSYFVFKERTALLAYFRSIRADLARKGIFVLDIYGGPDAMAEMTEKRRIDAGFTYVWDQEAYWPATGEYRASIHFRFKDGTEMRRAFRYDWRLWTLPEVCDLLQEAGFSRLEQFWEGTDEDGVSGNGVYRRSKRGENCEAWVTYVVAFK